MPDPSVPPASGSNPKTARSEKQPGRDWRSPAVILLLSLLVVLGLYAAALRYLSPAAPGDALSLDVLTRDSVCAGPQANPPDPAALAYCREAKHTIRTATLLDEDARIVTRAAPVAGGAEKTYWTSYPRSDSSTNDLVRTLLAANAKVTVDSQSTKQLVKFLAQFLLPLVVLANLFALLFSLLQGGDSAIGDIVSFGGAGDRRRGKDDGRRVTFADVAGADEAVAELAEVRDYLADPRAFAAMGALPPKGVLLAGPPGCGKTLLARAVAGEAAASFYSMSGSEFVEALVGVGAARVRDLFAQARAHAPAMIFIDELDAVARQRGAGLGQGHDEREQTLNEMLVQMDGFSPSEGIVVVAATNRPDILDPALLRAGRFDRHVTVERPDLHGRQAILRIHGRGKRLADPEVDLTRVASITAGFTGADLANVLNEASLLAVRERAPAVTWAHLEEAVDRVLGGTKRRALLLTDADKARIATHEAGHAVVAAALGRRGAIRKVSVIARGRGVGHMAMTREDANVLTQADMEADIAVAMAGFAAEQMVFGQLSTGSEADLERATHTARDMAGRYGMSEHLGPVRLLGQDREVFLGRDYLQARDVSQPTLEHLDAEVRRIVEAQKERAGAILTAERHQLDSLAGALARSESLQGADLDRLLAPIADRSNGARPSTAGAFLAVGPDQAPPGGP